MCLKMVPILNTVFAGRSALNSLNHALNTVVTKNSCLPILTLFIAHPFTLNVLLIILNLILILSSFELPDMRNLSNYNKLSHVTMHFKIVT